MNTPSTPADASAAAATEEQNVLITDPDLAARIGGEDVPLSVAIAFAKEHRLRLTGSVYEYEAKAGKIYLSYRDPAYPKAWTDATFQASKGDLTIDAEGAHEGGTYETGDGTSTDRIYFSFDETDAENNTLTDAGWAYLASKADPIIYFINTAEDPDDEPDKISP
jgi:hypothetical protein